MNIRESISAALDYIDSTLHFHSQMLKARRATLRTLLLRSIAVIIVLGSFAGATSIMRTLDM